MFKLCNYIKEDWNLILSWWNHLQFYNHSRDTFSKNDTYHTHSSFEQEKTVNEFLLGLWICFRAYGGLLSWPRWNFLLWKYCNQVALQSFFQKVTEIKNKKNFSLKKPFVTPNFWCRNFSRMHHFWVWIFLSPRINE